MKKRSERKNVAAAAKTIGLDLGDQTSRVCVLDAGGELIEEFTVPTTRSTIERKFRAFAPGRVVLETGTHANWIHDVLAARRVASTRRRCPPRWSPRCAGCSRRLSSSRRRSTTTTRRSRRWPARNTRRRNC
jgi:hypothetical protein